MLSTIEHFTKSIAIQAHPNRSHLSNSVAPIDHMSAPGIHNVPELREIGWYYDWILAFNFIVRADVPEVSPLRVEGRRSRSGWFVLFRVGVK